MPQSNRRLTASALILWLSAASAHAMTPEDGRRAYDAGRFTDAMGIWGELSRSGSAEAAFGLGLLYDLGNGTPQDPGAAFFWYRNAADAGLPKAEFNVAAMYDSGRGIAQNTASAALWYAKAAAHGHARAQFDLGQLYEQGEGVPRNPDAAAAWLQDAAKGGITAAAARLKVLQAAPKGRPTGPISAVTLVSPARNVTLALAGANPTVELVWTAPAEPQPVHYEVQVSELGGSALRTVFTASVTETAVIVQLPSATDFYVWNVNAVGQDGSHAPGDWNWFSIGAPAPPAQPSVTAGPQASNAVR